MLVRELYAADVLGAGSRSLSATRLLTALQSSRRDHGIRPLAAYLTGLLLCVPLAANAQQAWSAVTVDAIGQDAESRLLRAGALLENGQWREAVDNVMSVIESAGDRLIPVGSPTAERQGFTHYESARQRGHRWLASLSRTAPEALKVYRRQVDPLAERWFRSAVDARDEALFQRIVDEMFVSRFGDDALMWLGELARQRGAYTSARSYWERLSPHLRYITKQQEGVRYAYPLWLVADVDGAGAAPGRSDGSAWQANTAWLAYPDADVELDEVRLRLVVSSILEGHQRRAQVELRKLTQTSANSQGTLAGRRGRVPELAAELLAGSGDWSAGAGDPDWPTFGGAAIRSKQIPRAFDLGGYPIWEQPLPRLRVADFTPRDRHLRVAEDAASLLSIHPVITAGMAVYAVGLKADDIEAVDLQTGRLVIPRRRMRSEEDVPHLPGAPTVPRLTLSAFESTLFAVTLDQRALPGRLVALDLEAERKLSYAIVLAAPHWQGSWIFEGAPVTDGKLLYAAVRRIDQVRHESHLAAFDIKTGHIQWRRLVCEAEAEPGTASGYLSNLLTLDQGTLYYNSNLGAVAAYRAADGFPRWLVGYPRADSANTHPDRNELRRFRDLAPCLVHRDMVIVAPRDCERMFALDAISGALLWASPPELAADVVHLLGVADDKLLASGECLYWFDCLTGRLMARFPDTFHAAPGHARPEPRGYGRGLLAGERVYWPTRSAIFVFDQQTVKTERGWHPRLTRRIELTARRASGGHLLLHDDVLLIAAAGRLFAFNETGISRHVRN